MKSYIPEKVVVFDISEIVKKINENKVMPMDVPAVCRIINELSRKYCVILIPQKVLNEIRSLSDISARQVLRYVLSNDKVIIKDYMYKNECMNDDELLVFDFAQHASKEFKCPVEVIACDTYFCTRVRYTIADF